MASSQSSSSHTNMIEASLLKTVQDLRIRSEIQDCLSEIVTDVEIAVNLQDQLLQHQTNTRLEAKLQQHERALAESRAVKNKDTSNNTVLADALLQELWSVSTELGELQQLKQEHQKLVVDYNEVSARLFQTEENLKDVQHQAATAQRQRSVSREDASVVAGAAEEKPTVVAAKEKELVPKIIEEKEEVGEPVVELVEPEESKVESVAEGKVKPTAATPKDDEPKEEATDAVATTPSATSDEVVVTPKTTSTPAPEEEPVVVVLDDDDTESGPPSLEQLDTEIIMNIFGFLDALDILNTAQVNISMYSRVDALFGLGGGPGGPGGGGGGGNDQEDSSTIATAETAPLSAPSHSTAATASAVVYQPTTVTMPPPPPAIKNTASIFKPTPVSTTTTSSPRLTSATATASMSRGAAGLFSLLQPRLKTVASPTRGSGSGISRTNSHDGPQPMNAAMANSMASKLTDGELNAIILMTERLKQKESLADKLVQQNDELLAKLDGTEAVKQFLIGKVRDMEIVQAAQEDNETKVAQQIGSDQEVIAFLDGRVQEVERQVGKMLKVKEAAEAELERMQVQTEKKASVMGDMLQFERQRLSESDREYKATKKLLVKEVKNCRAQILSLQAERDGYREQNEVLRKAVLSPSGSMSRDRAFT